MGFTPTSQRDFISKDLGPALSDAGLRKVKLIIMDDQRFLLPKWADTVLADNATSRYVDGIGVHWYFNSITPASVLAKTRQRHPDKFLLSTEACEGSMPWQTKVLYCDQSLPNSCDRCLCLGRSCWATGRAPKPMLRTLWRTC